MSARVVVFAAAANAAAAKGAAATLGDIAGAMASDAQGSVPVESGEWRAGITGGPRGDIGVMTSSDPESFYKEYGTSDTPAHMVLTNTARRYGKYRGMTGRK